MQLPQSPLHIKNRLLSTAKLRKRYPSLLGLGLPLECSGRSIWQGININYGLVSMMDSLSMIKDLYRSKRHRHVSIRLMVAFLLRRFLVSRGTNRKPPPPRVHDSPRPSPEERGAIGLDRLVKQSTSVVRWSCGLVETMILSTNMLIKIITTIAAVALFDDGSRGR